MSHRTDTGRYVTFGTAGESAATSGDNVVPTGRDERLPSGRLPSPHRAQRVYVTSPTAERKRRWRDQNPEAYWANLTASSANRRAREQHAFGHIFPAEVLQLWARQPVCIRCGVGRGLDHIVSMRDGGTNTADNIQNLCWRCNARKNRAAQLAAA